MLIPLIRSTLETLQLKPPGLLTRQKRIETKSLDSKSIYFTLKYTEERDLYVLGFVCVCLHM